MPDQESLLNRICASSRLVRKLVRLCVSALRRMWNRRPAAWQNSPAGLACGRALHRLVCLQADRRQYFATFFLRNRAESELMVRLLEKNAPGSSVSLTVLACSKGAEVYSLVWAIRSARPDLQLRVHAIDISPEIVAFASRGVYSMSAVDDADNSHSVSDSDISRNTARDQNAWMFERMSPAEIADIFEVQGSQVSVRGWLRQGITWLSGDAGDPALAARLGLQDIVVANRFLCHMRPAAARACLRNIAALVRPGGHLFVTGIDLDVRTQVAREQGWLPVPDLLREVHEGDSSIRKGWPGEYWGVEPFDPGRSDSSLRYAAAFQVGGEPQPESFELTALQEAGR